MSTLIKITEFEVGQFIKYSDRDKSGKIHYIGEVILVDNLKEIFEILTMDGVMGFVLNEEEEKDNSGSPFSQKEEKVPEPCYQEFEIVKTKPKGWAKFKKNPSAYVAEMNKPAPKVKTKKEQIFDLVKNNPRKKERALIKLAKKELGGSEPQLKSLIKLAVIQLRK